MLELAIDRCRRWLPNAKIWVATEDRQVVQIAEKYRCNLFHLTDEDLSDRRNVSELMTDFLSHRSPSERCVCFHLTSPFTFRSELRRAMNDVRPFVRSAFMGKLHLTTDSKLENGWMKLSQDLETSKSLTGNFMFANGQHVITPDQECSWLSPVSLFSALDINTPEDLRICQLVASRVTMHDMED